jgi:hypothetical protein
MILCHRVLQGGLQKAADHAAGLGLRIKTENQNGDVYV